MEMLVARAGFLTSVQDLGRTGCRQFGVSLGGALDAFARLDAEFNRLCIAACRNELAGSMMQVIAPLNRRFWFTHHGRTLSKEGVEAHIEIALALSRGDAKAALSGIERLLRYVESRIGQSSVTA